MRIRIEPQSEEVSKDLAQKLLTFPELPILIVYRAAAYFKILGRDVSFSGTPGARVRTGQSRKTSFMFSLRNTRKNAVASLYSRLANILDNYKNPAVRRQILKLTVDAFRSADVVDDIIGNALRDVQEGKYEILRSKRNRIRGVRVL